MISTRRNFYLCTFSIFTLFYLLINLSSVFGQTDPFTLSPKWYFGNKAGLDFSVGSIPVVLNNGSVNGGAQEGSSGICDPAKNMVFYTDSYRLYDGNNTLIQNINGGTSSTQSSVSIPDPADPGNKFYLFTANVDDNGGGDKPASISSLGIHYYHLQKNAVGITILSGPVKIAEHAEVSEQLTSGTDGNGNYWLIAHEGGHYGWQMNSFWSWPVTSNGVGAKVVSAIPGNTGNNPWQGAIKINKCQTRLGAVFSTGVVEIYDWNQTTGKVTSMIRRITGLPTLYGCEFSPDGSILYYSSLSGNMLYQLDIATGTIYSNPAWTSSNNVAAIGTMQLGPDNKIYVLNASNFATPCYIGVINNPNTAGIGCNYDRAGFLLNNSAASYPNVQRGMANIAWLNPQGALKVVNSSCQNFSFDYNFKNYFTEDVSILSNSEEWDFGDGGGFITGLGAAPSHTYSNSGTYTVKVRFKDLTCNKTWTYNNQVTPSCALPVQWLYVKASPENGLVKISWATAHENLNDHFIIERSKDGVHFESIGMTKTRANSSQSVLEYEFVDDQPGYGMNYYRIKQVDVDGTHTVSAIATVINEFVNVSILPNPSQDKFTVSVESIEGGIVSVYDLLGREVFSSGVDASLTFGEQFPEGTYVVKIVVGESVFCRKVVKGN